MKNHHLLLLATTLACSCASAPRPAATTATPSAPAPAVTSPAPAPAPTQTSSADAADHWGDSVVTAVEVPADAPDGGVIWEMNWIYDQYGKFRKLGGGVGNNQGRRYDVIKAEFPDGSKRTIYFDITDNFNREVAATQSNDSSPQR